MQFILLIFPSAFRTVSRSRLDMFIKGIYTGVATLTYQMPKTKKRALLKWPIICGSNASLMDTVQ